MPVRSQYTIEQVQTPEAREEALQIRFDVFIKEQGVSPDVESDAFDDIDPHWLVRDEFGTAIATARLTDKGDGLGKVERVSVIDTHRGQGIGRLLLEQIEKDAKALGFQRLMIHAQAHCIGFYEKQGYTMVDSTIFLEENIPHVKIEKTFIYQIGAV